MTTVEKMVYVPVVNQESNKNKGLAHAANAAITAGGIATTAYGANLQRRIWDFAQVPLDDIPSNRTDLLNRRKFAVNVKNMFENLGEKIFKGKIGELFAKYSRLTCSHSPDYIPKDIRFNKGAAAGLLTAGIAALGILMAGIYKAGKINGEG